MFTRCFPLCYHLNCVSHISFCRVHAKKKWRQKLLHIALTIKVIFRIDKRCPPFLKSANKSIIILKVLPVICNCKTTSAATSPYHPVPTQHPRAVEVPNKKKNQTTFQEFALLIFFNSPQNHNQFVNWEEEKTSFLCCCQDRWLASLIGDNCHRVIYWSFQSPWSVTVIDQLSTCLGHKYFQVF